MQLTCSITPTLIVDLRARLWVRRRCDVGATSVAQHPPEKHSLEKAPFQPKNNPRDGIPLKGKHAGYLECHISTE